MDFTIMLSSWSHLSSSRYFPDHLDIEQGVLAEFAVIIGFILCLYGYRLLRVMVFGCGFLIAGLLTAKAFENIFGFKTWVLVASWIGFFFLGVAGGCVAMAFFSFGVFLVGSMLAFVLTSSLPYQMLPGESSTALDSVVVLLGGILAWVLVRPFAIVASSLIGSLTAVWGIGYFAGKYPSDEDLDRFRSHLKHSGRHWLNAVPGVWWVYLAVILVVFVIGIVKQCHDVSKWRRSRHIGHYTGLRSSPNTLFP